MWEKDYTWNPAKCACKNGKYLGSTIDKSVIYDDENIEMTKSILLEKRWSAKWKFYILLTFLLFTMDQNKNICYHFTSPVSNLKVGY